MISVNTKMFFEPQTVLKAMDRKTERVLSATGAFGRQVMKRGMRRRKGNSQPGEYPNSHGGQLREMIYFGYDKPNQSVVIGPTLFKVDRETRGATKTVPQLLNEGGTVTRIRRYGRSGKSSGNEQVQQYKPRPFINLTLPITAQKLAENMEKFNLA